MNVMKSSSSKKRRIAALNYLQGAVETQQALQNKQQTQLADASKGPAPQQQAVAATAPSYVIGQEAESGTFPYNALGSILPSVAAVGKLQLPLATSCSGTVEDVLEQLMTPNMPHHVARNTIASRTADRYVVLDNPTAKLNIMKTSKAGKHGMHKMTGKLLPRSKRKELSQLSTAKMDFAALTVLHYLWAKYINDLLEGTSDVERLLQTADWHGAVLTVDSSRNKLYTGKSGIVTKATANTVVIVSSDSCSSVIPLKGSVFGCMVPGVNLPVELTGTNQAKLQCRVKSSNTAS